MIAHNPLHGSGQAECNNVTCSVPGENNNSPATGKEDRNMDTDYDGELTIPALSGSKLPIHALPGGLTGRDE